MLAAVRRMDGAALLEARSVYTIANNVSDRLQRYNGIASRALYPPPPLGARYHCDSYGDYVLSVGRLDAIKRVDLLLQGLAAAGGRLRAVITGAGPDLPRLQQLAHHLGITQRVEFVGFVSEERLLELYAGCRAVYYAPYDEDYGFVTLEAMRSRKPIITTIDSGGVLEFIEHGRNGLVGQPDGASLAGLLQQVGDDPALCERLGATAEHETDSITWERVVAALTGPAA